MSVYVDKVHIYCDHENCDNEILRTILPIAKQEYETIRDQNIIQESIKHGYLIGDCFWYFLCWIKSKLFFRYFLLRILLVRKNGSVWARQKVLSLVWGRKSAPQGKIWRNMRDH